MNDLGDLKFLFGIEVVRSKEGIVLIQGKYARELISATGLSRARLARTPLEVNQKLTSAEYDNHICNGTVDGDAIF